MFSSASSDQSIFPISSVMWRLIRFDFVVLKNNIKLIGEQPEFKERCKRLWDNKQPVRLTTCQRLLYKHL